MSPLAASLDPRTWLPEAQRGRAAVRPSPAPAPRPLVVPAPPSTATATAAPTPRPESPAVARPAAATTTATTTATRSPTTTPGPTPTAATPTAEASRPLTLREKLLVASADLGAESFRVADLVVRAWRLYPETFSLEGHPEHPDSNRVQAKLCGADGLCGRGWLVHVEASTYRVTRRGRTLARDLGGAR